MHMLIGPDIRSQRPAFSQGVAFTLAIFRWNGASWIYQTEFGDYWWGTAGYSNPPGPFYFDGANEYRYNDQGFQILASGTYRIAVRYHWWANASGGVQDTSYNWAGIHQSDSGQGLSCAYS